MNFVRSVNCAISFLQSFNVTRKQMLYFPNDVHFGQEWAANLSHITTQGDLANTRFGGRVNALQLYQEAAWLTEQYSLNPSSAYGDIHATIWQLFDRYAPTPSSRYWLSM